MPHNMWHAGLAYRLFDSYVIFRIQMHTNTPDWWQL